MNIPDNLDIYEEHEREEERRHKHDKEVVAVCDLCDADIYEGEEYVYIEPWDRCICENCMISKLDDMWRTGEP
jgi:hypothetical protein